MEIFADTGGWLAYFDRGDAYYRGARSAMASLEGLPAIVYTSDYVVDEAITAILSRAGHGAAVAFGQWVQANRRVRIVKIDDELWQAAWEMFKRYDDKDFSFTDCTSFVIMQRQGLVDAFAFDHHFEQMGFRLWPTRRDAEKG